MEEGARVIAFLVVVGLLLLGVALFMGGGSATAIACSVSGDVEAPSPPRPSTFSTRFARA